MIELKKLTDEQTQEMNAIVDEWSKIALRTDEVDYRKATEVIDNLYKAVDYALPQVLVVSSPVVAVYVFGAAAWIWFCREKNANPFTGDEYRPGESAGEHIPTDKERENPIITLIEHVIKTNDVSQSIPYSRAALDKMSSEEVEEMARSACDIMAGRGGLECSKRWYKYFQGGGMWAPYAAYEAVMRDVVKLDLPEFQKYQYWEDAAKNTGIRFIHEKFCIVCDNPTVISRDDENRAHNLNGPSYGWADGWSIYHVHGVKTPKKVVLNPELITVQEIDEESNQEVKRIMLSQYGTSRYLLDSHAQVLSKDKFGILLRKDIENDEPLVMVRVLNSTPEPAGNLSYKEAMTVFGDEVVTEQVEAMRKKKEIASVTGLSNPVFDSLDLTNPENLRWKDYFLRVPPTVTTAHEAVAWTFGKTPKEYNPDFQS